MIKQLLIIAAEPMQPGQGFDKGDGIALGIVCLVCIALLAWFNSGDNGDNT